MIVGILNHLLRGMWLMGREEAATQLPLALKIIAGSGDVHLQAPEQPKSETQYLNGYVPKWSKHETVPSGSIHYLKIEGALTPEDQMCGPMGMDSMLNRLIEADANEQITGHLLDFYTPGGTVSRTAQLADTIAKLSKPVVAHVEMAASAGMWLAAACDRIVLNSPTAHVGSIGVLTSFWDFTKYIEEDMKGEYHEILATLSTEKNKDFRELMKGNYDRWRENELDVVNASFHAWMKMMRPLGDDEDILRGKMYRGEAAIAAGLADEIGDRSRCLEIIAETYAPVYGGQENKNMSLLGKQYPALSAVAAQQAKGEKPTEDQLSAVNAELEAKGIKGFGLYASADVKELQAALKAAEEENATLMAQGKKAEDAGVTLSAQVDKLSAQVAALSATLEKTPGATPTHTTPAGGTGAEAPTEEGKEDGYKWEDFPHNRAMALELRGGN